MNTRWLLIPITLTALSLELPPAAFASRPEATHDADQDGDAQSPTDPKKPPSVLIDGATRPQAISDQSAVLAMIHPWIAAVGEPSLRRRFDLEVQQMRLSAQDVATLHSELALAHGELSRIEAEARTAGGTALESLRKVRVLTFRVYTRSLARMTAQGANLLRQHLALRKSQTVVIRRER